MSKYLGRRRWDSKQQNAHCNSIGTIDSFVLAPRMGYGDKYGDRYVENPYFSNLVHPLVLLQRKDT